MAVTANQLIERQDECRSGGPVAESTTLYAGALTFLNASGYYDDDTASGVNRFAGININYVDNSGGSNGDKSCEVYNRGVFKLTGSGFAQTSVGKPVYASDNYTLTLTPTASTVLVGIIREYISATVVMVEIITHNRLVGAGSTFVPFVPLATMQSLSGAGACNVTTFCTKVTTTGANALTLADGVVIGQLKKIQLIVDGGDGTLTPTNLADGTTITFADVGDFAVLCWNGTDWVAIELGNDADGVTAPVLA